MSTIDKILTKQIPIWYLYLTWFLMGCFSVGFYQGFNEVLCEWGRCL